MLSWQEVQDLEVKLMEEQLCSLEVLPECDDGGIFHDIIIIRQCDIDKVKKIIKKAFSDWYDIDNPQDRYECESVYCYYQICLDKNHIIYQICMASVRV